MNFFKSILSEDSDPPISPKNPATDEQPSSSTPNSVAAAGAWSFGGLIKTLATQSESVIEIYRRDLKEFGSGLRSETAALRNVVKDLPAEIDGVLKSMAEIISHGTDSLIPPPSSDPDPEPNNLSLRRYSRFELQLCAIESDVNTYCEEPEDLEDFEKWRLGFVLEEKREENEIIMGIYTRVVPNVVDDETFWCRYFYKVHKLKQQEDARVNLVKRAISVDMDDELSWDVDDEDEGDDDSVEIKEPVKNEDLVREINEKDENEHKFDDKESIGENKPKLDDKEVTSEIPEREEVLNDEKIVEVDTKGDNGGSCKDSDVSIVSTQPSLPEEEDMGWDEIEDIGSGDEKKAEGISGSPNRADLRKRLSAAEEDEDLSWDIEDDDEPVTKHVAK